MKFVILLTLSGFVALAAARPPPPPPHAPPHSPFDLGSPFPHPPPPPHPMLPFDNPVFVSFVENTVQQFLTFFANGNSVTMSISIGGGPSSELGTGPGTQVEPSEFPESASEADNYGNAVEEVSYGQDAQ